MKPASHILALLAFGVTICLVLVLPTQLLAQTAQEQSLRFVPDAPSRPAYTKSLAHTFTYTFGTRLGRHMEQANLEAYHLASLSSAYPFQLQLDEENIPNLYYAEPVRKALLDALGHSLREVELYRRAEETFEWLKNFARFSVVKQGSSYHLYGPSLKTKHDLPKTFDMKATAKLRSEELFFTVDAGSLETRLIVDLLHTDKGSFTIVKHVGGALQLGLNTSWKEGGFETLGQLEYLF